MLKQLEGSQGVAQAVALCRPEVVCAYPISPQTHIVEALGALCRKGVLKDCEYINVESEFAAMSVAIGASVAGARAYTATASQGLLFMVEAVYNASGLGLPIVMTVANRAIGAPINIWNDHSDSMSQRDSGWIQLFAETNQEAVDLHIQAFRIAEELSIGAMVGPEAFTEVRWLAHKRMLDALPAIEKASADFAERFGRKSGGLLDTYRMEDAEVCVLAMGSILGTIKDTVDEMREAGVRIGVLCLKSYRPFPDEALREAVKSVKTLVVLERMVSAGSGGALYLDVLKAVRREPVELRSVIAGLGGRAVTKASLRAVFESACNGTLPDETVFLDLDRTLVEHQLAREAEQRHTGPVAESLNREVNERKILQGEEI